MPRTNIMGGRLRAFKETVKKNKAVDRKSSLDYRPPVGKDGRVDVTDQISPEVRKLLKACADKDGITESQCLENIIKADLARWKGKVAV